MASDPAGEAGDPYLDALERARIGLSLAIRPFGEAVGNDDTEAMSLHLHVHADALAALLSTCEERGEERCVELVGPLTERLREQLAAAEGSTPRGPRSGDAYDDLLVMWEDVSGSLDLILVTLLRQHVQADRSAAPRSACTLARTLAHRRFYDLKPSLLASAEEPSDDSSENPLEVAGQGVEDHLVRARHALGQGDLEGALDHARGAREDWLSAMSDDELEEPVGDELGAWLDSLEENLEMALQERLEELVRRQAVNALFDVDLPDGGELWLTDPPAAMRAVEPTLSRLDGALAELGESLSESGQEAVRACEGVTFVAP